MTDTCNRDMNDSTESAKSVVSFSCLLELAADNDVERFNQSILHIAAAINEIGLWYGHQRASKQMLPEHRTPLMVAATYGSVDVVNLILSLSEADVNRGCGPDKSTALHCAASSGSDNAVGVVKLLLLAGADPEITDAKGRRPVDVVVAPTNLPEMKDVLEELLGNNDSVNREDKQESWAGLKSNSYMIAISNCPQLKDNHAPSVAKKKKCPVDPSLPDVKNVVYSTDEFRMFKFKVRPCSRADYHDWADCPFVHPGEHARRRDPKKFHYNCVPCPEFKKGQCKRGDMCEYAHGVFECWLHPARYKTQLCKDGTSCTRRVCFFAHRNGELRPQHGSTRSAVRSPQIKNSAAAIGMTAALSLLPGSKSAVSTICPPFVLPMSTSANAMAHQPSPWPQSNISSLQLPGNNFQTSHSRSSLNAKDIPTDELSMLLDLEIQHQQQLTDQTNLTHCSPNLPRNTSNFDDLFSAGFTSPPFSDPLAASALLSPSHKLFVQNQLQQQQNLLSLINSSAFSRKNVDHLLLQPSLDIQSPGRTSPRGPELLSPFISRPSALAHQDKQQCSSLSSRDPGRNLPCDLVSNSAGFVGFPIFSSWECFNGTVDWSLNKDELDRFRRSSLTGHNCEELDFSWVESLPKDSPPELHETSCVAISCATSSAGISELNSQVEKTDLEVLGAWLDQVKLDQIIS